MRVAYAFAFVAVLACADAEAVVEPASDASLPSERGIELTGSVFEFSPDAPGTFGLAEVELCQEHPRRCTYTDVQGRFVLDGIEPEREILLTIHKDGITPVLIPLVSPRWSASFGQILVSRPDVLDVNDAFRRAGRAELATPNGLPSLLFAAYLETSGVEPSPEVLVSESLHVRLEPDPGGDVVYYVFPPGRYTFDRPGDEAPAVYGMFVDIEPREDYELVYEFDGGECARFENTSGGWPARSGRPNAIRVPVRPGYLTFEMVQFCSTDR